MTQKKNVHSFKNKSYISEQSETTQPDTTRQNLFLLLLFNHSWNKANVEVDSRQVKDKDPILWGASTSPSCRPGEEGLPSPRSESLTSPAGYLQVHQCCFGAINPSQVPDTI